MSNSWMHIKTCKYEYGKIETTFLNLFLNCPQICTVLYRTSKSGTKPSEQQLVYVTSEQRPYSYAVRSKFFEFDSPISSPSLAWLPWPFSRGVPLSISKLTPYAEDSLCGRETGECEWGKPLRRTFCWRPCLSSTFTIEEDALLCSLDEAAGCILMGIPFSGTPLASQMLKQLKYVGAGGIFTLTLPGPRPGRKTNTMGIPIISFVSPSGAQETVESYGAAPIRKSIRSAQLFLLFQQLVFGLCCWSTSQANSCPSVLTWMKAPVLMEPIPLCSWWKATKAKTLPGLATCRLTERHKLSYSGFLWGIISRKEPAGCYSHHDHFTKSFRELDVYIPPQLIRGYLRRFRTFLKIKVKRPQTQLTLTVYISGPLSLEYFTSFRIDVILHRKSGQ